VAVVLAFFVSGAVSDWSTRPAEWLSGQQSSGGGWNAGLWQPLVTLVVELIVLEVVIRLYTMLAGSSVKR
jgi:hypothetical protein